MNLNGRFTRVSDTTYHDGVVLVGFCGDVYPHDLTPDNVKYIKTYFNMPESKHTICAEWPENVSPAYSAAKKNFINGFLLLQKDGESV